MRWVPTNRVGYPPVAIVTAIIEYLQLRPVCPATAI